MDIRYITLIVSAVTAALLVAVLILIIGIKREIEDQESDETTVNLFKSASNAITEMRRDNAAQNEAVRRAVTASVNNMGLRLDRMSERFSDQSVEIVRSLAELREKNEEVNREQTKTVNQAILRLQESNEKKLEEMRATVDEKLTSTLTTRLDSSFRSVSEQLSNVYKSLGEMKELSGGVTALNRIFTNVKTRGNWAETQLEGILDKIIPGMYVKNYSPGTGREAVEFAIIIPDSAGGKPTYLPVDSKFPVEDYLRLCEYADAGDAEGVKAARKALENRVLAEAKEIRKYVLPPETTPFAILYLATDPLYAEILSSKENIADRLHDEYSVLLAGPSTITALLSSLAMGFRTIAVNQKAAEVLEILGNTKLQYDKFTLSLEKAKKKIDEAGRSLDEAQHRNDIIVKKLRSVETADPGTADDLFLTDDTI